MNASAAIADSLLRQACVRSFSTQAGGLAPWSFNVLTTRCALRSNGSPVRLPLAAERRVPIALLLQWVQRLATPQFRDEPS